MLVVVRLETAHSVLVLLCETAIVKDFVCHAFRRKAFWDRRPALFADFRPIRRRRIQETSGICRLSRNAQGAAIHGIAPPQTLKAIGRRARPTPDLDRGSHPSRRDPCFAVGSVLAETGPRSAARSGIRSDDGVRTMIKCREIGITDLDAVADLLTRGFQRSSRDYWMTGLRRLSVRDMPEGYPRFGYMLDNEGTPVGALQLIYTAREDGSGKSIRCNVSSWYVEPAFRSYAPMLTKVAQRHEHVAYVNISPAPWTWRTIEAQGFRAYCSGFFCPSQHCRTRPKACGSKSSRGDSKAVDGLSEADVAILTRLAAYGCLGIVCRAADDRGFPFVLQQMRI